MDFWDLTRMLFRRWYVALPLLAITMTALFFVTSRVKPDYKATSYVQLVPPAIASATANVADLRNPWLELGLGTLNTAATYSTVDKTFLNQLKDQGLSDNVVITEGYPAPIATVEVIGPSQSVATRTTDEVVKRFSETVKGLQDDYGVKPGTLIVTRRLDTGKNLEQTGGKVKRALIAVAGAGVLLTIGLTIGFDAAARRRSRRRGQPALGDAGTSTAIGNMSVRDGDGRSVQAAAHLSASAPSQRDAAGRNVSEGVRNAPPPGSEVTIVLPRTSIDQLANRDGGGRRR